MKTFRVIARGEARVPYRDAEGRPELTRFAGRRHDGTPAAEDVPDSTYYRRAVSRADLAEVPAEAPPPDASDAAEAPAAPSPTEP